MRQWQYLLVAAGVALVQITLKSMDVNWVIPNLCLVLVVWLGSRLSLSTLTGIVLLMGSILLIGSAAPTGLNILALFLVVLVGRFVFHQGRGLYQLSFQIGLLWAATIAIGLLTAAAVEGLSILANWQMILFRIGVEGLYNMIILVLLVGLVSTRQREEDRYHRLPN